MIRVAYLQAGICCGGAYTNIMCHGLVVFAQNYCNHYLRVHAYCHVHFFHHVIFYLRFRKRKAFPVWGQLCCGYQVEDSSTIFSANIWKNLHFFGFSSLLSLFLMFKLSSILRSCSLLGCLHGWSYLHFWGIFHFEVQFIFYIFSISRGACLSRSGPVSLRVWVSEWVSHFVLQSWISLQLIQSLEK